MNKLIISVVILTKNRAKLLNKNLSSLSKQIIKPSEIVIIDNNSIDKTQDIIKKYKRTLKINHVKTAISGYPKLYNLGIKKAKGELICFLDDDCLASKDWLFELIEYHKKYPNSVIQGQTFSLPKNNLYAQIMGSHYQNWLKSNLINQTELRFLDNKNCAIPKKILKIYSGFSEKHSIGSEDLELSLRLRGKGIKIIFCPQAIAYHHERTNFKEFLKQHYRIAKSEAKINKFFPNDIGLFPGKKTFLNLYSAIKQEFFFLKSGDFINFLKLPFVYLLLFFTRIFGYLQI